MLCDKPIAAARLDALPGVTTCIECTRKHPRKLDTRGVELSQASPITAMVLRRRIKTASARVITRGSGGRYFLFPPFS